MRRFAASEYLLFLKIASGSDGDLISDSGHVPTPAPDRLAARGFRVQR